MQFGVSESIAHWGLYRPTQLAIHTNDRQITYRELNSDVDKLCHALSQVLQSHQRVGLAVRPKYKFLTTLVAILRLGKHPVVLLTPLGAERLGQNAVETGVEIILHDRDFGQLAHDIERLGSIAVLNVDEVSLDAPEYSERFHSTVLNEPADEWGILYSSGSTGSSKAVQRDHYSIITELLGWCLELGLTSESCFYMGRPIIYAGGLALSLSTLIASGSVVLNDLNDDNDAGEVWSDYQHSAERLSLAWGFFAPDHLRAFTQLAQLQGRPVAGARAVLVMGAPISGLEKLEARSVLGSQVIESWGNTESLGTITDVSDLDLRPDSIGRPFITDEMYVVDDDGKPLPPGALGRIAGSDDAGFLRYENDEAETARVRREEKIITDDMGFMDEDGYFYIRGRRQESLVIDGSVVFLAELERKLRGTEIEAPFCLVVCDDAGETRELWAVIEASPESVDTTRLLQSCNARLEGAGALTRVLVLERMPRLPSGKPNRPELQVLVSKVRNGA